MRRFIERDAGFSLVELSVAILVLGIVLIAFLPMVAQSIQLAAQNQRIAEANQLVATQIESFRNNPSCTDGTSTTTASGLSLTTIASDCSTPLATITVRAGTSGPPAEELAEASTRIATGIEP